MTSVKILSINKFYENLRKADLLLLSKQKKYFYTNKTWDVFIFLDYQLLQKNCACVFHCLKKVF